jgi:carboxylate-amine ligase
MTPEWASWNPAGAAAPWTVGLEEEVMLLDDELRPASRSEEVLGRLAPEIARSARAETHGSALELATDPQRTVGAAVAQLAGLRAGLAAGLEGMGLRAAASGTHPLAQWRDTEVSPGARYQFLYSSLRELARREPTFALHVHVAVPDPARALRALNGVREHLPVLLALSANSPFWQGRDSGLASARIPVFQTFPRTGVPRWFDGYEDYVEAIDVLLRCDAIPEPTFLWWDARLQPRLGTLEVRIMDAQSRVEDTAVLAALVQCLVHCEAVGPDRTGPATPPEVLDENRFLAARDGMAAELVDPAMGRLVAVADRLDTLVAACMPYARALGCERELALAPRLCEAPGAARQRVLGHGPEGLVGVLRGLVREFEPAALPA